MLLQEASKARFINQIWDELEEDPPAAMDMTNYRTCMLPSAESMIKWVDSGAANSFLQKTNFNWQNFAAGKNDTNGDPLYVSLLNAYFDYKDAGGSRKEKHEYMKKNPYEVFKQSGLKVINSGVQDASADMMLLPELENKDYVFVVPLTWEACKFMDSFECGGAGAKWCIGYEKNNFYFEDYTERGYKFVLAFRKTQTPVKEEIKYMIMLSKYNQNKAWRQDDDAVRTIPESQYKEMFGWSHNEMLDAFEDAVLSWDDNVYAQNEGFNPTKGFDIDRLWSGCYGYDEFTMAIYNNHEFIIDCGGRLHDDFDIDEIIDFVTRSYNNVKFTLKFRNGSFKHLKFTSKEGWLPWEVFIAEDVNVERMDCSNYTFNGTYIVGDAVQSMFVDGEEVSWPY